MIGSGSSQGGASATGPVLIVQDVGRTFEVALGQQSLAIGRAPDNDIVITSRFVSGRHARIEPHGIAHQIVDIGSTNGLLFEGKRLPANTPHVLADSDVLRIGDPATGNFVTLTYRNPQAPKFRRRLRLRAVTGSTRPTHRSRLGAKDARSSSTTRRCRAIMRSSTV